MADVLIFLLSPTKENISEIQAFAVGKGVEIVPVNTGHRPNFNSMFGRLIVGRDIPNTYDHILYLDGDTQIRGSLNDLLAKSIPAGKIAATNDPISFIFEGDTSTARSHRAYMHTLGLNEQESRRYFNSGVIYTEREMWIDVGERAMKFWDGNSDICRRHDQSALNFVCKDHISISLKWNFPVFLKNIVNNDIVDPTVFHFMSNPRPWYASFPPWDQSFVEPYDRLEVECPDLSDLRQRIGRMRYLKYALQQQYKKVYDGKFWHQRGIFAALKAYEEECATEFVSLNAADLAV